MEWKHKRQSKIVKATLGAAVFGVLLGGYSSVWAADNIIVDGTQDGSKNTVTVDKTARVVGTGNTIDDKSEEVKIVGDRNKVTNSDRQLVFGDDNEIINREMGIVDNSVRTTISDVVIGKGNKITDNEIYRKPYKAVTIIGNNNELKKAANTIVIGDNQTFGTSAPDSSIIIGSLTPEDVENGVINWAAANIAIGHGALNRAEESIAVGNRARTGYSNQLIMGNSSSFDEKTGTFGSIYGHMNRVENSEKINTFTSAKGASIQVTGSYNAVKDSTTSLVYGSGNKITNSQGYSYELVNGKSFLPNKKDVAANLLMSLQLYSSDVDGGRPGSIEFTKAVDLMHDFTQNMGGNITVFGNGNIADYTNRSQIWGNGNTLTGNTDKYSVNNTIGGFSNIGESISQSTIIGAGNIVKNSEDNLVLGDYHAVENGKHNIIIGSRSYIEKEVEKDFGVPAKEVGFDSTYKITERTAEKPHTANISNAVMLGYNTDVSQNGGVALGSDSVGSVGANNQGGYNVGNNINTFNLGTDTTWNSNLAAISVGDSSDASNVKTRQITNLAAGKNDTDAVNVAQLKSARVELSGSGNIKVNTVVDTDGHLKYTISSTGGSSEGGSSITYTAGDNISITDGIISATDTRNTLEAGSHIGLGETKLADGSIKYTVNVKADGKVESGNTGLVTGGAVYNETHVSKDGNYVKQSYTAGQNLVALDSQVKTNTDSINSINNQITDMNSSVTNLGNQVNRLDNRIERVGAGAAALAALHPQDFDPEAKWDIAAGYGNYRSANAVAIGAFYRPSADKMFSIGTSLGGGENMINVGVSLKLGSSSPYTGYSKAALANVVAEQSEQLQAQNSTISALQEKVALQAQENEVLRTQVQDIMRQLAEIKK
ncbi:YadA-like family protein [Veillonella criceti]|uniref:Adhesin yadA n=1 Tax=Veillonella criceti TaxID=103891 RepID=A0A380NMR5_9FIRM|nr:YadA-like family protein [Veillonella criceti]SUP44181.1 Adhesin yadA precursor [Veillonella criceti]